MSTWVTAASFDLLPLAEIARGRLLAEGIDCHLTDQHLSNAMGGILTGGIKLKVDRRDLEQAQAVLARDDSDAL